MIRFCAFVVALACGVPVAAQDIAATDTTEFQPDSHHSLRYYFLMRSGMLLYGADAAMPTMSVGSMFSFENGLRIGQHLSVGGGMGMNSYHYVRIVPVFGNVSAGLGRKNQLLFGWRYGVARITRHSNAWGDYGLVGRKAGAMSEIYVGYAIKYHDVRLSLTAGYLRQRISNYYEYPNILWVNGTLTEMDPSTREVKMQLSRLAVTLGVGWN